MLSRDENIVPMISDIRAIANDCLSEMKLITAKKNTPRSTTGTI